MEVLLRGIKQIIRILKTEPLASIVEYGTWADNHLDIDNGIFSKTDDQIRDLIKERLVTMYVLFLDLATLVLMVSVVSIRPLQLRWEI